MILKMANNKRKDAQDILAADIGATKTNIAVFHYNGSQFAMRKEATYQTQSFQSPEALISKFVGRDPLPGKISIGVAGPVQEGKVTLTNVSWQIDRRQLSSHFHTPVFLINDLEATGYGLAVLEDNDLHLLHEGKKAVRGNVAIIAPGTGLGEAGLYFDQAYFHPFATEGGHCDFAPSTGLDTELYHFIKKSVDHVSWERIVSGPGICTIYDFLHREKERGEPAWLKEKMLAHDKAAVITSNADECAICREALELFIQYLARESANLVLKIKATGGLFVAGGIVPQLLPSLHENYFLKWFSGFGRMKNLLQAVPIKIILNKKAPLLGAAYFGINSEPV
jgi:glucokinase